VKDREAYVFAICVPVLKCIFCITIWFRCRSSDSRASQMVSCEIPW